MRALTLPVFLAFLGLGSSYSVSDHCSAGSAIVADREYCSPVSRLTIEGIGNKGTYSRVTSMPASGPCSSSPFSFSGPLAPFDEDLSFHLRGPIQVAAFAVFVPSGGQSPSKRSAPPVSTVVDVVLETDEVVIATLVNGPASTYTTMLAPTTALGSSSLATGTKKLPASSSHNPPTGEASVVFSGTTSLPSTFSTAVKPASTPLELVQTGGASNSRWNRIALYSASSQTADGLVFLNNRGGQGSGVFDDVYGPSISYASADSFTGTKGPTVWNGYLGSSTEIAIFSNKSCTAQNCGFWRPGAVAYEGFTGTDKLFVIEFTMPHNDTMSPQSNQVPLQLDVPAIWLLNAQIPRIGQYLGVPNCSCWPACGELDIMEVLTNETLSYMTTTVHLTDGSQGGSNDYFTRPTTSTYMKAAILMTDNNVYIQVLPDSFDVSAVTTDQIAELQSNSAWSGESMASIDFAASS